jgi:hypothetical protein
MERGNRIPVVCFSYNFSYSDGRWKTDQQGTISSPVGKSEDELKQQIECFMALPEHVEGIGEDEVVSDKAVLSLLLASGTLHLYFRGPNTIRYELGLQSKSGKSDSQQIVRIGFIGLDVAKQCLAILFQTMEMADLQIVLSKGMGCRQTKIEGK